MVGNKRGGFTTPWTELTVWGIHRIAIHVQAVHQGLKLSQQADSIYWPKCILVCVAVIEVRDHQWHPVVGHHALRAPNCLQEDDRRETSSLDGLVCFPAPGYE